MKAKHVVIASLATALLGGLTVTMLEDGSPRTTASTEASVSAVARDEARFPWREGVRDVYAVSWHSETGGLIAPAPREGADISGGAGPLASAPGSRTEKVQIRAESEIEAEVLVEGLGPVRDGFLAAVSYGKVRRFAFQLQGHDAVEDEARVAHELEGHPAFVTFSPRGEPLAISFEPSLPASTRTALRALVAQLQWTQPLTDATEWTTMERDAVGKVRVRYQRSGGQLHRTPLAFETLDAVPGEKLDGTQDVRGEARLSLDAEGMLVSMNEQAQVRYVRRGGTDPALTAEWTFSLERLRQERFDVAVLRGRDQAPVQPFSTPVADQELGARRDARLAQGVSVDSLTVDIDHFEAGQRPSHDQVIRAGAYLRLHPEAAAALVEKFQSPELTVKGRGYILDMLAQAGDGPAQAAIRRALESPVAQERPRDFSLLVQRFTFVIAPEPESAEFLVRQMDRARGARDITSAQGSAVALGSTVRRLAELGKVDDARRYDALLRNELGQARDAQMQRGLLAALGNAARLEDVDAIRGHAGSEDPLVRDQVASSLRHLDSPSARETLLTLATDAHSTVAVSAFSSLRTQTMDGREWSRLAEEVKAGKTPIAADAALVTLVREKRALAGASGDAILATVLARNGGGDNDLAPIIRQMLASR